MRLIGVEAAGRGIATGEHSATLSAGRPGVLHGSYSYLLQDENGQIQEAHSISAGLDYPGVGPEHSFLKASERAVYESITDDEALEAFETLCHTEGIIPALESSHAVAHAMKLAPQLRPDEIVLINLSGRGDKDLETVGKALEERAAAILVSAARRSRRQGSTKSTGRLLTWGHGHRTTRRPGAEGLAGPLRR